MPAKSPTANFVTSAPTCEIRPTISCPGTIGYIDGIAEPIRPGW
jgi:hypothetical protein